MPTLAEKIIDYAEAQVGVTEVPMGSNRGPKVEHYQSETTLGGTGWPWCAAFVCDCWKHGGVDNAKSIASPSTYQMCQYAKTNNLVCSPRAAAAIVWCSKHVEILHTSLGGGNWRCIGGNTGDAVRWTTRNVAGATIYAPPGLAESAVPDKPVFQTLYWLEDLKPDFDVIGPWTARTPKAALEAARKAKRDLPDKREAVAKVLRAGPGKFVLRVGQPPQYGPWRGLKAEARRKDAKEILEERLGRKLRLWSERVRLAPESRAEALGKVD